MKKIIFIVVLLAFVAAGCGTSNNAAIQASGQIEAQEVSVASELSGRVVEVNIREGDSVKAGDALLRLDDSLLISQKESAQAALDSANANMRAAQVALDTAQAQYRITLEAERANAQPARLSDWFAADPGLFDQPGWYFSRAEQIQAAEIQTDDALKSLNDAKDNLAKLTNSLDKSDFLKAEERLLKARLAYLVTRNVKSSAQNSTSSNQPVGKYNSTHCGTNQGYRGPTAWMVNMLYPCTGDPELSDAGETLFNDARAELVDAQNTYNALLDTQEAKDVLKARADVAIAEEYYYSTLDFLRTLQTGDQSPAVSAAQSMVDQAQAALDQAQTSIAAAQANLNTINLQLDKLTVHAPMDGVVLVKSIDVGEVLQAGMPAFSIGKLDSLKVTVYIPETEYGQIRLGQSASLSVDSFPNETFTATVTRIADQAEFTPQNVQTKEGRQTTVYAIELTADNADGKLKPGMPVDVTFK